MVMISAHLVDQVLPKVPMRQFVLALPKRIRYHVARDPELFSTVLKIFIKTIEKQLKRNLPEVPKKTKIGAVTFIQRFGSSLNFHVHYHTIVIEGLFYTHDSNAIKFAPIDHLGPEDSQAIQEAVRKRVVRLFKRRGLMTPEQADDMLKWRHSAGFSVNADVGIDAEDRSGLERLLRYCARPAFASDQLSLTDNDMVCFRPSKPTPKGETELTMKPEDFLDKVAKLIPKPRKHRHHYHGVLASNSPYRKHIVQYANQPLPASMG